MFPHLQIYQPRERALAGVADAAIAPLRWLRRLRPAPPAAGARRVLLLRLERIGDLLMTLDAIHDARAAWPDATIDLAVGSWNAPLATLLADVNHVEIADVPWLARGGHGDTWPALVRRARGWRRHRYDLVINLEPDIRSNLLAWLTAAPRRVGYWTGGGGAFLTDAAPYDPAAHVSVNARRLIARAAAGSGIDVTRSGLGEGSSAETRSRHVDPRSAGRLAPAPDAVARADAFVGARGDRPVVGVHVAGGRESKQWHLDRFAAVARALARDRGATIVLTGSAADRLLVDDVRARLAGVDVVDAAGALDLPALAALLARLDLLVTSDTGPMHLAAAMGTPIVALFGPADPRRYGPIAPGSPGSQGSPGSPNPVNLVNPANPVNLVRVLRVDLPCSPCGQVRLPPERCRGHVPDCMDGITVEAVVTAAIELLDARSGGSRPDRRVTT